MKKMTQEELNKILEEHRLWLESNHKEGKRANLRFVDLTNVDLRNTNLMEADFFGAYLNDADLRGSDLRDADLMAANLENADLRNTNLNGADLRGTDLSPKENIRKGIILTKKMIGYKKCENDVIVKLEIPKGAVVFSINNHKCRTNIAKVIDVVDADIGVSYFDASFVYRKGETLKVDNFDLMYNVECSTGIHFFRTIIDAIEYSL